MDAIWGGIFVAAAILGLNLGVSRAAKDIAAAVRELAAAMRESKAS